MNDFNKPIRPISREDKDKVKVEPIIEKFRDESNQNLSEITKKDKKNFILSYLGFVKNFFNFFTSEESDMSNVLSADSLWEDLKLIKTLLIKIRDEDPTDDLKFAEKFSEAWHRILDHYFQLSTENTRVNSSKVKQFIQAIQHYPEEEDHSLGFYLQHYSGQEWFPVPFFKLLKKLHEEYFSNGKNSDLDRWIALASEILVEAKKT